MKCTHFVTFRQFLSVLPFLREEAVLYFFFCSDHQSSAFLVWSLATSVSFSSAHSSIPQNHSCQRKVKEKFGRNTDDAEIYDSTPYSNHHFLSLSLWATRIKERKIGSDGTKKRYRWEFSETFEHDMNFCVASPTENLRFLFWIMSLKYTNESHYRDIED